MAGQTISDRFLAARHSLAGQGLAKSVCKATTEELIGPKKKHLDYLVQCTNEPNVSIPQLANLLIERSQSANWVVVYKALVTVHHLMCFGNERFTQYLASSNSTFQLHNFFDKSGVQGYDMSPFIRRYSRYLNEKAMSYRTVAFDFCKTKRGKEDGTLRTMNAERLIKTLPTLQQQLDALLEFDCSPNDLNNGVINMSFMLLFKDLIRLFASYNDGIINLLEKFFDMNKKQCRDALDIYKKFLVRMDRVAEFLKVAENMGIDKGDIPDLTKAPSSLLDALEQHLGSLDGKKSSTSSTPSQSASNKKSVRSGVSVLSVTSSSFGNANGRLEANGIDESLKQKVLAEEEAAINQFKTKVQSPTSSGNNPFLSNNNHTSKQQQQQLDFFSDKSEPAARASEDLLQLNNPFADFGQPQLAAAGGPSALNNQFQGAWLNGNNSYPGSLQPHSAVSNGTFVTDSNFRSVFGNADTKASDALGGVLQPTSLLAQMQMSQPNEAAEERKKSNSALLTGDLETSLASLAQNLSINRTAQPTKGIQWNSPKNGSSKVGSSWNPQPMSATTGAGYKPMNQAMSNANVASAPQIYPQLQPMMAMRQIPPNAGMMQPMPGMQAGANPMGQQQSLLFH